QGCTRKTLATLVPVVRQHATAPVYVLPTVSPVSNAHPAIAFSAHEQPRQKGRTVFGGADFFGDRTVGFETFLVPLVLIPGNVSWQSISEKYHALLRWDHSAPGAGSARNLLASIHGSAPVGVGSSIHGILEHVVERHPIRTVPLKITLGHALVNPHRQLH